MGIPTSNGAKIIMTTALTDTKNVIVAYMSQCDAYLTKPIQKSKLLEELCKLGLIK
jgi:two-component system chemotaxis response regulator CheY